MIKKAPEPSDIIWENYSVSSRTVRNRKLRMFTLMAVFYLSMFYISLRMYTYRTQYDQTFSLKIICSLVVNTFYE